MNQFSDPCRVRQLVLCLIPLVVSIGCQQTSRDLELDQVGARAACETALNAWQEGKQPADLKPEIIVGDWDWQAGLRLVSYEVLSGEEFNDGTNLHIPVRLTLENGNGKESTSEALYIVGTSPVITVIRD